MLSATDHPGGRSLHDSGWAPRSIVARHLFDALVALLGLEGHGRDRAGFEAGERDGLAGHFAIAVFALVEPARRAIDLGDQLALAVAGAKLDRPVGLARCAVGKVGLAKRIDLELGHGRARLLDDR